MYGIEYETENMSGEFSEFAMDNPDIIFCKSDGSLSQFGVEIVFHPHTLLSLMLSNTLRETVRHIKYAGGETHDNCGLHIHVNRSSLRTCGKQDFSGLLVYKIISLFNGDAFTREIGKRDNNGYCDSIDTVYRAAYAMRHKKSNNHYLASKIRRVAGESWNRYVTVNTNNASTIEFRFFAAGEISTRWILACVQILDLAIEYCRQESVAMVSSGRFAHYALTHGSRYKQAMSVHARVLIREMDRLQQAMGER
jgi:hypothetical protein